VTNVFAYQKAVGEAPGYIKVPVLDYHQEVNWGGLELGGWEQGAEVEQITVDSLSLTACHFIKVDVEGMELSVLKGAAQTIRRFEPLLYVENDRADKSPHWSSIWTSLAMTYIGTSRLCTAEIIFLAIKRMSFVRSAWMKMAGKSFSMWFL